MGCLEALVKMVWGTDERARQDHAAGDRMLAEAEAKVEKLQRVLDDSPARNLDEALVQLSHRE